MEKKIQDYLAYYIGQEVVEPDGCILNLEAVFSHGTALATGKNQRGGFRSHHGVLNDVKLRLRPLSDMTREEIIQFFKIGGIVYKEPHRAEIQDDRFIQMEGYDSIGDYSSCYHEGISFRPEQFQYLLKQGFDLFGLIEAGLAVDKTKEGK